MADERDEWIYDFIHSTSFNRRCAALRKMNQRQRKWSLGSDNMAVYGKPIVDKFIKAGGIPVLLRFIKNHNLKANTGRGGLMDALMFATSLCKADKDGNILKIFHENGAVNDVISSHITSKKILTHDYLLLLTFLCDYEPARNEMLTSQRLVIIYDHLAKVPKDYGENDMERALAFIKYEVKRNANAREQLAKAGCVGRLVKAAKLVIKQLDKGYRVESYIHSIVLCLSHIMTENISTVPEAEKEGQPGILFKVLPTNFYSRMPSFRPCVIILMYVMWDTESMQKLRRDKKFQKCESAIIQFHKKYTTLGYERIDDGLRCKPYATRLVEKLQM